MKKQKIKWTVIAVMTIGFIMLELSYWPGYLVHDYFCSTSRGYGVYSDAFKKGTRITQYFMPQMKWLGYVEIAATFDESAVENEQVKFSLYDGENREIYSDWINISEMEDGKYYTIPIKKKLKTTEQYHWTVEATENLPYEWCLMLSEDKTGIAPENTFVEADGIQNIGEDAQTVSQYSYYIHKDKVIILATCWCGTFLVYLICLEAIGKIFNRISSGEAREEKKEEKKHDI